MFTGIVTEVGTVRDLSRSSARAALTVAAGHLAGDVSIGDSVAVDGVCLTVTEAGGDAMRFDVVTETLERSSLGSLRTGDRVNLEGALRVGDRLSGHFVMGHVDGVGEVVSAVTEPGQTVIRVSAPDAVAGYLLEKGSVAVNGVSLTTWDVRGREFSVAVVPHTLFATTLGGLRRRSRVNLEADVLARWVARLLEGRERGGLTMEKLRDAGFDAGPGAL